MLRDSLSYFAARAGNGLLGLAAIALLTRLLGPEQYGVYAVCMAVASVAAAVLFQWLGSGVLRFRGAKQVTKDELLTATHFLFVCAVAVAAAILTVALVSDPFPAASPAMMLLVWAAAIAIALHDLHLQASTAWSQPWRYALIALSRGAVLIALATALVLGGFGLIGALAAVVVSAAVAVLIFGIRWTWKRSSPDRLRLQRDICRYGGPVALGTAMTMVFSFADRFLLGWWHGASAVAGYAAAYDLAQQTVGVALNVFFMAGYPKAAAAWESGGAEEARIAMDDLQRALLLVAPLIVGLFIGLDDQIAAVMFGAGIRSDAATVLPLVALAISIGCLKTFVLDVAFHLAKATGTLLRIAATMAALNLLLNVILIPHWGFFGAALATLATFSTGTALSWWFGRAAALSPRFLREAAKAGVCLVVVVMTARFVESWSMAAGLDEAWLRTGLIATFGSVAFALAAWVSDLSQLRSLLVRRKSAGPASSS